MKHIKKNRLRKKKNEPKKIFMVSLGCAKNLVDTEVICGKLATAGFMLTNQAETADVLLINTCSFIGDARNESAQAIEQGISWRRNERGRRLVTAGCWPQQAKEELQCRYPEIDLFLGLDDVRQIEKHIQKLFEPSAANRDGGTFSVSRYLYDHTEPRLQLTPPNYAYVKIAEGCNHKCKFCTIPAIRGQLRSRAPESVICECRDLLDNGVRELNFIAQDVTAYGRERNHKNGLVELLKQTFTLKNDFWLRLLYTHPQHITEELLDLFERENQLLPYLDMPLQHIDDHILRSMGRGMGEAATMKLLERIDKARPRLATRTTFIVGYPGEDDQAFEKLLRLIKEFRFDHVGVFAYSPEPGTEAAGNPEVPPELAAERKEALMKEQRHICRRRNRKRIGTTVPVLTEERGENGLWIGRTAENAPEVDGKVIFKGKDHCLENGIVNVNITEADDYDLMGVEAE